MSETKVLGAKIPVELYSRFHGLNGSVSTNLRKAVVFYLNHLEEEQLTTVNHVEKQKKYEDLISHLEKHEADIQRLISDSKEIKDFDKFVLLIFENIALSFRLFQVVFDEIDSLYEELEPIEKIKAEQRKLSGKGLDGSGGRGKKKNLVANFPPGLDNSVSSDTNRFEQEKDLEQTEKPKAKERQKSTKKQILQEKGKTRDKVAEQQKGSIWEGVD